MQKMGRKEEEDFVDHERSRETKGTKRKHIKIQHKKRKRRASVDGLGRKLLVAAGLGDSASCERILDRAELRHYNSNVVANWSEGSDLSTALHAACRVGSISTVKTLVRRGSCFKNKDLRGNTPLHCAALRGNYELILWVLERYPKEAVVGMEEKNDDGVRAEDILESVMERETFEKELQEEGQVRDENEKWRDKIMSELEWEQEEDIYYGSSWCYAEYETADEYAERIWQEMQEKMYGKTRTKKKKMYEERPSKSNTSDQLEENRQESWKQAVSLGDYMAKKARYEAQWEFFCSKAKPLGTLKQNEIPWIVSMEILHSNRAKEELEQMLWSDVDGPVEKKKVVRKQLIRWHPDKFMSQFGACIDPGELDVVRQGVNTVSQLLATIYSSGQ